MARYKLTFTDENTGTTYLLDDNMPDYDSAVFAALDYVAEGACKADKSGDTPAITRLFNAGLSMAVEFGSKKGLDYVSCCGFTITRKGE
jgi:hypothetical protein